MTSTLQRPRHRDCVAAGIDCGGAGFHRLVAIESISAHWKRKGEANHAIVTRRVTFKAPCICAAAQHWIEHRVVESVRV